MRSLQAKKNFILWIHLVWALLIIGAPIYAQKNKSGLTIKGNVTESGTELPVEVAYIVFNHSVSVLSAHDGSFQIQNIKPGEYEFFVSCLGYEDYKGKFKFSTGRERLNIRLKPLVLSIDEVTVVAKSGTGSRSTIGQDAIRHIQPKSIADMLQLLPGGLTSNPTLNGAAQTNIREIGEDANNALGTSVILDGMPLSNDANLQALSPTKNGLGSTSSMNGMNDQTTAGRGVDLRTVGADNIESIEVIRGIPSVEYGNLTSGVVIVKTKSGKSPLEVKFKADPFSKLAYAGKGFGLKHGGAINFGVDWSQSYGDVRKHYLGYDRVTASLGYSNVFNAQGAHPVSFNFRSSFYSNINNRKHDAQMDEMQVRFKNENTGLRLAINGNIGMNNWLTALDYDVSAEYAHTIDSNHEYIATPDGVITNTMTSGLAPARFITQAYYSDYRIEGKPFTLYARLKGNKYLQLSDRNFTNFKLGVDYKMDGNKGDGLKFDINTPPQAMNAHTLRPRSFKDIPTLHNLSAFFENISEVYIGKTALKANAGVRISHLFLDKEKSGQNSIFVAEPRINLSYNVLNRENNAWLDELSLNGGFGISNKMPTLLYLYPDKAYFDNISLAHMGDTPASSLALMHTHIEENTVNPDLKPQNSQKWEVGLSFRIGKIKGYVNYFNEHHKNEFGFSSQLIYLKYNRFNVPHGADQLKLVGNEVQYTMNGQRHTADFTPVVDMGTWGRPDNNSESYKHGIEYAFDFGTIPFIRTSVNIDGAWFHIKRQNAKEQLRYIDYFYDYVPVMPAGYGTISNRTNTNFRFITHIPKVSLIFTTTVQVVWNENVKSIYQSADGDNLYHTSDDGKFYVVNPIGFHDRNGNYTPWQPQYETHPDYERMNRRFLLYDFEADTVKPWVLLNFRFTKEFGKIAELSFTANNFANLSKWHIKTNTKAKRQLYPDMYFGAELKFKF